MQIILELIMEMSLVFFVEDFYKTISNNKMKRSKRKLLFAIVSISQVLLSIFFLFMFIALPYLIAKIIFLILLLLILFQLTKLLTKVIKNKPFQ